MVKCCFGVGLWKDILIATIKRELNDRIGIYDMTTDQ